MQTGRIADCSPAFAHLLDSMPSEVIGSHSGKIFESEDGIAWREALEQMRDREVTRISRVPVKVLPKNAKHYSAALIWASAIYHVVDAPATYVLVHLWPSEVCAQSTEEHEMQLMMRVQRIERELGALAARPEIHVDHATRVGGNVGGDFTGGNKNNPEVFRWLVIGFLGLVTASIWWWYYQHGGTYVPPDAIPRVAP